MRRNLGTKPYVYPQPVFIIGSYDENGVADAMNAAWGSVAGYQEIALYLGANHKTVENILKRQAFTVSMADDKHVVEADYVGLVSANDVPDKLANIEFHTQKSEFVDAPLIDELPLTLECQLLSYDKKIHLLLGKIMNVSADEAILDDSGLIDLSKLGVITFDPVHNAYIRLGEKVGNAFQDGNQLK